MPRLTTVCGGGESLQEACLHAGVSAEEILKRLHENSQRVSPAEGNWTSAALSDLTAHIKNQHHKYVREAIPRINALLDKVKQSTGALPRTCRNRNQLSCRRQGNDHAHAKEEQILFPFIEALDRAANGKGSLEPPFFQTVRNPIHAMMKEHDAAGDLVKQIRKASTEYAAPADVCTSYKALYQELGKFERDLHQHVHLENNILFPRAVDLEAAVI